jgi:hypothetical protein
MINKLISWLNRLYPLSIDAFSRFQFSIYSGLFVFLFLFLFRPFEKDVSYSILVLFFVALGYGLVSFLISLVSWYLLFKCCPKKYLEEKWTIRDEILATLGLIFTIGLGNFLFNFLLGESVFSLAEIIEFQGYTFLIGAIIAPFCIMFELNVRLRKNLKTAREMNAKLQSDVQPFVSSKSGDVIFIFSSENQKEQVKVKDSDLIFIRSADNYVEIFKHHHDQVKMVLLRSSLKRIEETVKENSMIHRCHRAYLVNLKNVHHVAGNAQGYVLSFKNTDLTVPVARNYSKKIKQVILNNG